MEVFFKLFTSEVGETHYENRTLTGRRCVFELRDDSGRIDLVAFDEDVKKLESFELKIDTKVRFIIQNKEYCILITTLPPPLHRLLSIFISKFSNVD